MITLTWLYNTLTTALQRTVTKDQPKIAAMRQLAGDQIWKEVRPLQDEYRELYESYLVAAKHLDGDAMPRELKHRINSALNNAAKRFNAQALAEVQKPE